LIRGGKPVFLAVNKAEGGALDAEAENFRQLGIREVYPVSAEHGLGIGELLDAVSAAIPEKQGIGNSEQETEDTEQQSEIGDQVEDDEETEADLAEGATKLHRTHGEFEQHETSVAI